MRWTEICAYEIIHVETTQQNNIHVEHKIAKNHQNPKIQVENLIFKVLISTINYT